VPAENVEIVRRIYEAWNSGDLGLELFDPSKQETEDVQRFLDAFIRHDTSDRLPEISAPTLVLAGGRDTTSRPELCRAVAELFPGARFEVMEEEAHQPFQEVPDEWNTRVDAFWREVERRN
jgi:pimeloyl-ACP methyl ester carboxylesterase